MVNFKSGFVVVVALFGLSAGTARAQAVVNPSFESGDFTGWTLIANGAGVGETTLVTTGGASNGTFKAVMSLPIIIGSPGITALTGTIRSSTFSATAGSAVTFDWRVQPTGDDARARAQLFDAGTNTVVNTFFNTTFSSSTPYATASFTVTTTGTYYLEFQGGSFDASMGSILGADFFVDNINGVPSGPGVTVTPSGGSTMVAEGGATDTYTVVLNSLPTANVTIAINPGPQLSVVPASLTFTAANWNAAQTVTVSAIDDALFEGAHSGTITHTATSTDAAYNGIAVSSVTATITDNDTRPPGPPEGSFTGSGGRTGPEGSFGFGQGIVGLGYRALAGPFADSPGSPHWQVFNVSHRQQAAIAVQQADAEVLATSSLLAAACLAGLVLALTRLLMSRGL